MLTRAGKADAEPVGGLSGILRSASALTVSDLLAEGATSRIQSGLRAP